MNVCLCVCVWCSVCTRGIGTGADSTGAGKRGIHRAETGHDRVGMHGRRTCGTHETSVGANVGARERKTRFMQTRLLRIRQTPQWTSHAAAIQAGAHNARVACDAIGNRCACSYLRQWSRLPLHALPRHHRAQSDTRLSIPWVPPKHSSIECQAATAGEDAGRELRGCFGAS